MQRPLLGQQSTECIGLSTDRRRQDADDDALLRLLVRAFIEGTQRPLTQPREDRVIASVHHSTRLAQPRARGVHGWNERAQGPERQTRPGSARLARTSSSTPDNLTDLFLTELRNCELSLALWLLALGLGRSGSRRLHPVRAGLQAGPVRRAVAGPRIDSYVISVMQCCLFVRGVRFGGMV